MCINNKKKACFKGASDILLLPLTSWNRYQNFLVFFCTVLYNLIQPTKFLYFILELFKTNLLNFSAVGAKVDR